MKANKNYLRMSLAIVVCAALVFVAQKKSAAAGTALAQDKGRFTIQLNGQTVGHEEFEIAPLGGGWTAKGTTSIKPPGGAEVKVTGSLVLQPDGAPISYDWTSQADKTNGAHIQFVNGVAKITLQMQGAHLCSP